MKSHKSSKQTVTLRSDLMKRVKQIELSTRKMVDDMMGGQFKSQFKGHGVQFSDHRIYMPGDDVRHIDWKVSARTRDPLIKKFEEERELTVLLVVDVSQSNDFGSVDQTKSEVLAEIAGMIAYAATHTGDKVGALLFAGEIEKTVPPKKGRSHVLRIIGDVLGHQTKSRGTNLAAALEGARRVLKQASVVFVLSDFRSKDYDIPLKQLSRKHDVVGVWIQDPRETEVPDLGVAKFWDPESGEEVFVDTGSFRFREWLKQETIDHNTQTEHLLKTSRVEALRVSADEDHGEAVVRFFKGRRRRNA